MSFADYFAMGGYAAFIWPSYGVALVLLAGIFVLSWRRLRAAERTIEAGAPRDDPQQGGRV
jgi:heme exporter protein D